MRYKLQTIIDDTGTVTIYDPNSIDWSIYNWTTGYYKHYVSEMDIIKFYNIPFYYYNNVDYEDILLLLNGIENPWDLYPGVVIKVPKLDELDNFIVNNIK